MRPQATPRALARMRRRLGIGDLLDVITHPADDINAVGGSVADIVTSAPVLGPVVDGLSDDVKDFANTAVGRIVLSAMASSLTGALMPILGPQLATIAFALPGVAAGQDFVSAWLQEFNSRAQQTAAILGDEALSQIWKDQFDKALAYIHDSGIDLTQVDFHDLAKAAGIREDLAAWLVAGALGDLGYYQQFRFDVTSGNDATGVRGALQASTGIYSRQKSLAVQPQQLATQASSATLVQRSAYSVLHPVAAASRPVPVASAVRAAAPPPAASHTALFLGLGAGALVLVGLAAVALKK